MNKSQLKHFVIPKVKYGISSAIATSVDYSIFFVLVSISTKDLVPLIQAFAYICGVLVNFFLRKTFVFELKRSISYTFSLSISFSLIGMVLSAVFIYLLTKLPYLIEHLLLTKILITFVLLIYNFYANRYAFEKRGPFSFLTKDSEPSTNKKERED